jgi:1-acyl-sn-glycerol-3-phosphate acyltransferase
MFGISSSLPLHLAGWRVDDPVPREKKYVALAYPHTSNWDGALLLALTRSVGMHISWMIKNDWVRGPMGVALRRTGAIAVNRKGAHNLVDKMVEEFKSRDELALFIPPEGTRRRAERWKSGFYHIARGANVPVIPAYLDYRQKRGGFGPAIHLTGNVRDDMDKIRAYYKDRDPQGFDQSKVGPIRLREEDEDKSATST